MRDDSTQHSGRPRWHHSHSRPTCPLPPAGNTVWYDLYGQHLAPTADISQRTQANRAALVALLCWFHLFLDNCIEPVLCDGTPDFRQTLTARRQNWHNWVSRTLPHAQYSHPLASTFAPFQDFLGGPHTDVNDGGPTILLDFGAHACLDLHDYDTWCSSGMTS